MKKKSKLITIAFLLIASSSLFGQDTTNVVRLTRRTAIEALKDLERLDACRIEREYLYRKLDRKETLLDRETALSGLYKEARYTLLEENEELNRELKQTERKLKKSSSLLIIAGVLLGLAAIF